MWGWSTPAWQALHGGHFAVSRVDVWHAGRPTGRSLVPTSGSVQVDVDSPVRRSLTATLVDPTGELSEGDVGDLLNAYECEVVPYRGVLLPSGPELAPLGVFGLTGKAGITGSGELTIKLTGQDRAIGYQTPMVSALPISAGTPVEVAIRQLLLRVNDSVTLLAMRTGFTVGPLLYEPDTDVWDAAQKLAESVGARLFHDRLGQCVLAPAGTASDRAVAAYSEGDGLLQDGLHRTEDTDTIRNQVRVESEDGSIVVTVADEDPTSPTYVRGRYPRKTRVVKNPHIHTIQQAMQAGAARLAYELGRSETVSFTATPNPGLDVDEVVTVHRPISGLNRRGLVVATLDIPLSVKEPMQVGCRKSRLAQDGRVLPELEELAA